MCPAPDAGAGSRRLAVMHMVDTLETGGAERVAVNIVNELPRSRFVPHLCTTRRAGPLAALLQPDVALICLRRRGRFDLQAIRRLVAYIREHRVAILHAHGASLFVAILAARLVGGVSVVWHVHFGRLASDRAMALLFGLAQRHVHHAITVSQPLMSWARVRLGFGSGRISYVPNFTVARPRSPRPALPGPDGQRIVCVANLVPEKGHTTLIEAMRLVTRSHPSAHLILVGSGPATDRERMLRASVAACGLEGNVTFLGQRSDVESILAGCDIGALASNAEGLPLALIEYGAAGLPVVVTDVGQCADVVAHGEAGMVIPPRTPGLLAQALVQLLDDPVLRRSMGAALRERVAHRFDSRRVVQRLCAVYERVAPTGAAAR